MTMDARTLEALKGSVKKWSAIAAGEGQDLGAANCPLCREFVDGPDGGYCIGCPVAEHTNEAECFGTPYMDWVEHFSLTHSVTSPPRRIFASCPECRRLAQAELDFLRSLVPAP